MYFTSLLLRVGQRESESLVSAELSERQISIQLNREWLMDSKVNLSLWDK